ncbi:MAG: universal stress protein [Proteobacteria bacterium]|nr:universal stress protein [Pseudomonadota bacterium]
MSYKTILVNLNTEKYAKNLLQVAATLAAKHEAHLIGLYVVPAVEVYPAVSMYVSSDVLAEHRNNYLGEAKRIEELFNKKTSSEAISAEWRVADSPSSNIAATVSNHALTSDLVVVSQADEQADDLAIRDVPWQTMLETGRPVLIVPYSGGIKSVGEHILVGWNGTREATRATFDALPLLTAAKEVHIHWANPGSAQGDDKTTILGAELASTLARHDVNVETKTSRNPELADGDVLLSYVAQSGSDLLVMGGYGHSRAREMIFGGATRQILDHMTIPVLMSH